MDIRPAKATDFERVWPLMRDFPLGAEPTYAVAERSFASILAHQGAALLVASAGEGIVGYALVYEQPTLFADGPSAYVQELMVDEARRGSGIGGALMAAAEQWARDRGCRYVRLATSMAEEFYRARGYDQVAAFFKKPL
ncbi:GNAT family N-acetyltransferase [Demequina lutea]|uniref:GNAT superfamily N-acetyltransferase n=1 Tax=Demequina lutea TaxID=431489 RepID=A0A7Y9ZB66_9MICO|nr:GNAT family N-acetyltransferase [Demequina lutea]NYI41961.1 GNAT superfamily N-acetyltransferase [Demequina lutea]